MRRASAAALLALAALVAGGTPAARSQAAETRTIHHVIRAEPGLRWTTVDVSWTGDAPSTLRFALRDIDPAVRDARTVPAHTPLEVAGGRIALPDESALRAITYRVDHDALHDLPRRRGLAMPIRGWRAATVALDPAALLVRDGDATHVTARVEAPEGVHVSVPWSAGDDTEPARVLRSCFHARCWIGFSRHGGWSTTEHGVRFDVQMQGESPELRAPVDRALHNATAALATLFAEPPTSRVQVLIEPSGGRSRGVVFGNALHGAGAGLLLYVQRETRESDIGADWVTTHELLHHAMPRIARADAWMSEGFATYYQELLRARGGTITTDAAWERLLAGFGRGRRGVTGHDLRDDSLEMPVRHAFHRVYWSGAAVALLLDVELRRRHGRSLDAAMREMVRAFGTGRRPVRARALIEHLDAWLGEPLFTRTAERWLGSAEFPDVSAALEWLGVANDGASGDTQGVATRRAMTTR